MRLAYLGNFREQWNTESYIAHALGGLGHSVIKINEEGRPRLPDCDVFLYAKGRVSNFHDLLKEAKAKGILTVCWLFDIYWGTPREKEVHSPIFKADLVFTTDGGHEREWRAIGVNHRVLRQGIHEPEAFIEKAENPQGVCFVGSDVSWNEHRVRLLSFLQRTYGTQYHRYGQRGFGEIRGVALNKLFAMSKVVVGDSYPSPDYWSNRVYETLGRGGFYLHPPGISDFIGYEHYVPYHNERELKEIIDYYLDPAHEEERERIRRAGHQWVKQHYTYRQRCTELCKIIATKITGTPAFSKT